MGLGNEESVTFVYGGSRKAANVKFESNEDELNNENPINRRVMMSSTN